MRLAVVPDCSCPVEKRGNTLYSFCLYPMGLRTVPGTQRCIINICRMESPSDQNRVFFLFIWFFLSQLYIETVWRRSGERQQKMYHFSPQTVGSRKPISEPLKTKLGKAQPWPRDLQLAAGEPAGGSHRMTAGPDERSPPPGEEESLYACYCLGNAPRPRGTSEYTGRSSQSWCGDTGTQEFETGTEKVFLIETLWYLGYKLHIWELSRVTVLSAETDKHCKHLDTTHRDRNLRYFQSSLPAVPVRGFLKQQSLKYSLHPSTTTFSISYFEMSLLAAT